MYRGRIIACITNRRLVKGDFLAQIERVAAMEMADWLIVREKDLRSEEYRTLFAKVARIVHKGGKKCLAHGRIALDVMSELGADGIHLPLDALRKWLAGGAGGDQAARMLCSLSAHRRTPPPSLPKPPPLAQTTRHSAPSSPRRASRVLSLSVRLPSPPPAKSR